MCVPPVCTTIDAVLVVPANEAVTVTVPLGAALTNVNDALVWPAGTVTDDGAVPAPAGETASDTTAPPAFAGASSVTVIGTLPPCATDASCGSSVAVVGGKLVAIGMHGGVLGVWRETGGAPTFYGLPEPLRLVRVREWPLMALTDGKSIDVLAHGASGYYVIRVPAT